MSEALVRERICSSNQGVAETPISRIYRKDLPT